VGKDKHNAQQHKMSSLRCHQNPAIDEEKSTGFAKKRPVFEEKSTVFSLCLVGGASETMSRPFNCGGLRFIRRMKRKFSAQKSPQFM
jgi:hypothetical protein